LLHPPESSSIVLETWGILAISKQEEQSFFNLVNPSNLMAKTRMVMELGMGTSLVSQDYTKAACRAIQDALYHNSLHVAQAFGASPEDMVVELEVGVQQPDQVDVEQVRQQIPYGRCSVRVVHGGLDIPQPHQRGTTTVANVAVVVYLDLEPGDR
jgi:uncharacterized protein (TIGR02058 family)